MDDEPADPADPVGARADAAAAETALVLAGVGPRLRSLRQQRGATLAEVSAATGVSVSTLSRLESGQRRPTLELLLPLARVHRVPLEELVAAPASSDPRVRSRPVVREGRTMIPLTRRPGAPQAYKILLPPVPAHGRGAAGRPEQRVHDGHDWLYVLSGQVRLLLADDDLLLVPGEAAEFDTRTPHWFGNPGPGHAEVLALFGPQGERLHARVG